MIKILFLGEIIGLMSINVIKQHIPKIKNRYDIDFIIANADGASDGFGVLRKSAETLLDAGVNVLTSGDLIYNKKDIKGFLNKTDKMVRPFNLPDISPGIGYTIKPVHEKFNIGVLNILGRTGFHKMLADDPFRSAKYAIENLSKKTNIIIIDFHGGATSEIQAFYHAFAGEVTAIMGTNLRILTSDNRVLKNKTGVITGTGYCGAYYSVGGFNPSIEIKKFISGEFLYSKNESSNIFLQGAILEINENNGNCENIELFKYKAFSDTTNQK